MNWRLSSLLPFAALVDGNVVCVVSEFFARGKAAVYILLWQWTPQCKVAEIVTARFKHYSLTFTPIEYAPQTALGRAFRIVRAEEIQLLGFKHRIAYFILADTHFAPCYVP